MLSSPSTRSLPAVLNGNVFLQCPTTEHPCIAQAQTNPAVPNHQVSLQCPTAEYPCSAQRQSILSAAEYPCSAQPQSILSAQPQNITAVPNRRVSLQCPAAEYPCSAQPPSIPAVPNRRLSPIFQEILHLLSNMSFRVGMLEVNDFGILWYVPRKIFRFCTEARLTLCKLKLESSLLSPQNASAGIVMIVCLVQNISYLVQPPKTLLMLVLGISSIGPLTSRSFTPVSPKTLTPETASLKP